MIQITENRFEKYAIPEEFKKIVRYDSISHMWIHCVKEYADITAIVDKKEYTYAQLDRDAAVLRGVLVDNGIKKGSHVGIQLPNSYDFVKAYIAIQTMGCVAVLLPEHLDDKTVYGCTMKYKLDALIYLAANENKMTITRSANPGVALIEVNETSDTEVAIYENSPEDYSTIVFTGGTTGKSKGALLTHKAMMSGIVNGCYGYEGIFFQKYMLILPLTHVFGLIRNMLTPLYTGCTNFICRNPKDMFKDMAVFNPTTLIMVPALAEMALNLSKQFQRPMYGNALKNIICGASAVPPYLMKEYDKLGVKLMPGYGLTESANLVSGNPENLAKPDSVGIPYPGQQFKIVDGELWIKGDNMMTCYFGEDEENENAYTDGWFMTGDLVRFDEEGFLYITGRKKDVIVLSSGENVSPEEVEAAFCKLDILTDAMVYDDYAEGREVLVLEVFPRATELSKLQLENEEEYIRNKLNEINATLPAFMRVSKFIVRTTDFERTPAMKKVRKK